MHEAHALLELGLLVLLCGVERPLEVVEHGQQLVEDALVRARRERLLLAGSPLAVVVELGREPLQAVEVLGRLGLGGGEPGLQLRLALSCLGGRADLCRGNLPVPPDPLHRSAVADGRLRARPPVAVRIGHGRFASSSSTTSYSASSTTSSSVDVEPPLPPPPACEAAWALACA